MKIIKTYTLLLGLALGALFAPLTWAQILPFPPTPSGPTPALTIQDSTYKKRVEPRFAKGRFAKGTIRKRDDSTLRKLGHLFSLRACL